MLRLLTTNLSARQISAELFVSPNTVSSHMRAIYRKLGVHSRVDAVARAEHLGLLGQWNHLCDSRPRSVTCGSRVKGSQPWRTGRTGSSSKASLATHFGSAFAGMALENEGGQAVLTGRVRDQAELQGVLQCISDLGLTLVSATAVESDKR